MTAQPPRLHLPSEPLAQKRVWQDAVNAGADLRRIVDGDQGIAAWLWERWRVLEAGGFTPKSFTEVVDGYRRELWLWLAGERTWNQSLSGLIGRIERRYDNE